MLDQGLRLYAVDSYDAASSGATSGWAARTGPAPTKRYEDFVLADLVPAVHRDCGWLAPILATGPSLGAFQAADCACAGPTVVPKALCLSGVYDMDHVGWGERADAFYFTTRGLRGRHGRRPPRLGARPRPARARGRRRDAGGRSASGALSSTLGFARLLAERGIPHELDVWGPDTPHDWPSWARMLEKHLPRLV